MHFQCSKQSIPRCWLGKGWVLFASIKLLLVRNRVVVAVALPEVLVKEHGCEMILCGTKS